MEQSRLFRHGIATFLDARVGGKCHHPRSGDIRDGRGRSAAGHCIQVTGPEASSLSLGHARFAACERGGSAGRAQVAATRRRKRGPVDLGCRAPIGSLVADEPVCVLTTLSQADGLAEGVSERGPRQAATCFSPEWSEGEQMLQIRHQGAGKSAERAG